MKLQSGNAGCALISLPRLSSPTRPWQGGGHWSAGIQHAAETCRAFVPLCSPTYGDPEVSPWTFRELSLVQERTRVPLIPVWHSGEYPPSKVREHPLVTYDAHGPRSSS